MILDYWKSSFTISDVGQKNLSIRIFEMYLSKTIFSFSNNCALQANNEKSVECSKHAYIVISVGQSEKNWGKAFLSKL